ncbi:hypothetical protein VV99796_00347 [Vibrio vulnificus]|nr:hypothetical protein VV99796_00347 [Vibrio vulnificus]
MLFKITLLMMIFFLHNGGNKAVSPDLPVRMGLRAAHAFAFVLKHLNPRVTLAKLFRLRHPCGDDLLNLFLSQLWQSAAVIRRETDHSALPFGAVQLEQRIVTHRRIRRVLGQRRKIVFKDKGALVIRVDITANARVGRAQKTGFFIAGQ